MHSRLFSSALLVLASALAAAPSHAETSPADASPATSLTAAPAESSGVGSLLRSLSSSFDATVASRYLFQGIDYSDGRSVVQPNFSVSRGPLSAVAWANYQPNLGDVNEVDLSLKATHTFQRLTISPGYTYLRYPNRDWDPSQEVFADLSVAAPLSPTLSVHYDFDAGDGSYSTLGLSQPLGTLLTLGTNVFYQSHYYAMTGVPAVEIKASASFPYAGMTLTPSLSRFATSDNGDFTGAGARVPSGWLLSINVVPKP